MLSFPVALQNYIYGYQRLQLLPGHFQEKHNARQLLGEWVVVQHQSWDFLEMGSWFLLKKKNHVTCSSSSL